MTVGAMEGFNGTIFAYG